MKRITVYCGSNPGDLKEYAQQAKKLAEVLTRNKIGLVYGGGGVGLMGILADEMLKLSGEVIGVIPEKLFEKEVAHKGLQDLRVVKNMHERKALMAELCDGFIALPGGIGTFEEVFETLTWLVLGYHEKPVGILNVQGFYDLLDQFLNQVVSHGFLKPAHQAMLLMEKDPEELLEKMGAFHYEYQRKWLE